MDSEHAPNLKPQLDRPPLRVVSLVPSLTESLFDLNLGNRLVGITTACLHPQDKLTHLPRLGNPRHPDIDAITALQPNLVLMNGEQNREADANQLTERGIPVWISDPRTVQAAFNLLWDIMEVFNEPSMAERVRWIERQADWTTATARASTGVRVFVPIWYNPWVTFNSAAFAHDLLGICGGENVFAELERDAPEAADWWDTIADSVMRDPRYLPVSLDEIIDHQPEVVLLPSNPYTFTQDHVAEIARLDIPAAHHKRIHLIDGSLLTWPGTRIAYALAELPSILANH